MPHLTWRRILFGLVATVLVLVAVMAVRTGLAIDRCLDQGGRWDEQARRCDMGGNGAS